MLTLTIADAAVIDLEVAMATTPYPIGTTVSLPAIFSATPDTAPTCVVTLPDNIEIDLSGGVVTDAPGQYHALYTPEVPGLYRYRWSGSSEGASAAASAVFEAVT